MNKNGTVGILADINKEKLLRSLIVKFDEESNSGAKVSYKGIYDFVRQAHINKKIDFFPSYTWWKTKGKHLVDEYNMIKKKTIRLTEKDELDIVDIMDLIDKYCGDREALIKYLTPYDILVNRLVERINELENINLGLNEQLNKKDNFLKEYEEKINKQQYLIDSLFYMHISSEAELINILNSTEANYKVINYSLTKTFEKPEIYLEQFTKVIRELSNDTRSDTNKIIQLKDKENNLNNEDEYDW